LHEIFHDLDDSNFELWTWRVATVKRCTVQHALASQDCVACLAEECGIVKYWN